MRIGLAAPYPWEVPGGVVAHIRDLSETLLSFGHEVSVIAPVDDEDAPLPSYVVRAGRTVPVPFNGSVSRLKFGPVSATRVRRWIHDGEFDVLHLHSPETLSLPLLALFNARGPIVGTFHAANPRSRVMAMLQSPLQVQMEKLNGRIAVSPAARKTIVEHLGSDAVLIPNGVHVRRFAQAEPL
ncbi:MAG TPA: glycosyltransferase family 4 protein, partial [Mycobacteriales bacterium]|nr:glycosyltransferase family 4 protein [Mycobacteriales bacterium]